MKKLLAIALSLVMTASSMVGFAVTLGDGGTVNVNSWVEVSNDATNYASDATYYVNNFNAAYDLKATIDMSDVNNKLESYYNALTVDEMKIARVEGEFDITVNFPYGDLVNGVRYKDADFEFVGGELNFDDIFTAEYVTIENNDTVKYKAVINNDITGQDLFKIENGTAVSLMGDEITLICLDATKPSAFGTYTYDGSIEGYTDIIKADETLGIKITYNFNVEPANLTLVRYSGGSISGGGGSRPSGIIKPTTPTTPVTPSTPVDNSHDVEYNLGSGVVSEASGETVSHGDKITVNTGHKITLPEPPTREGYVFQGWLVNGASVTEESVTITKDTVISAKWANLSAPSAFNSDEHILYIKGYPDGNVRPEAQITREEVSMIFYRLLAEEKRSAIETTENNFSDVAENRWSNLAVATLANGGYITGYPDGTFAPAAAITRAEFATIIARFIEKPKGTKAYFTDVAGHWAEKYIADVVDAAWVNGYEDGSFRPDALITRAEAMKIVNNMLVRYTDEANLDIENITLFPDNAQSEWYFFEVVEATNPHDFTRREDGFNEDWTAIKDIILEY